MKSLKQYITESLMILEKFSSKKLRDLVKKHGKVDVESQYAPLGFFHDKDTGVNGGRLYGSIIPHLKDEDILEVFDKTKSEEENGNDMVKFLNKNATKQIKDINYLCSSYELLVKYIQLGYFWIILQDGAIVLFKVSNQETIKNANNAFNDLHNKFKSKKK